MIVTGIRNYSFTFRLSELVNTFTDATIAPIRKTMNVPWDEDSVTNGLRFTNAEYAKKK